MCPEAFFCSHLDSYSHYLREYGESVSQLVTGMPVQGKVPIAWDFTGSADVAFVLDDYAGSMRFPATKRIAQVAAICNPMPWDVRKPDGSPAYDLIVSSIPWMVDEARAKDCRAEYQQLAFDTRARVCGMGFSRDLGCIFIGTTGPNHVRRMQLLAELADVVTVMSPVFGREYFKTLARAKVVFNVHAEWARGAANNMRMFEAAGMGACMVSDGWPSFTPRFGALLDPRESPRARVESALEIGQNEWSEDDVCTVMFHHTYESRIPQLVEWARSL